MASDLRKRAEEFLEWRGKDYAGSVSADLHQLLQAVRDEALEEAAKKLEEDAADVSPWRDAAEEVRALKLEKKSK